MDFVQAWFVKRGIRRWSITIGSLAVVQIVEFNYRKYSAPVEAVKQAALISVTQLITSFS
jgi:hypothetical protein